MLQLIAIVILFLGAAFFLGRMVYRSFQAKTACSTGCGKCGALDFEKIEENIRQKALPLS
ncbi:MAG: FeoB-associated Cys-rich membrane protein [Bacteroidota bacterium]